MDYDNANNKNGSVGKIDRALISRLAANIKGGDFYEPDIVMPQHRDNWHKRQNPLFVPFMNDGAHQVSFFDLIITKKL